MDSGNHMLVIVNTHRNSFILRVFQGGSDIGYVTEATNQEGKYAVSPRKEEAVEFETIARARQVIKEW